jgi:hypothetical protein
MNFKQGKCKKIQLIFMNIGPDARKKKSHLFGKSLSGTFVTKNEKPRPYQKNNSRIPWKEK